MPTKRFLEMQFVRTFLFLSHSLGVETINMFINSHSSYIGNTPAPPPPRNSTIHRLNLCQRKSIWETNYVLHWIESYPVYSAIQTLNNWGPNFSWNCKITFCPIKHLSSRTICPNKTKALLPIKSWKTFFTYHNPKKINVIVVKK